MTITFHPHTVLPGSKASTTTTYNNRDFAVRQTLLLVKYSKRSDLIDYSKLHDNLNFRVGLLKVRVDEDHGRKLVARESCQIQEQVEEENAMYIYMLFVEAPFVIYNKKTVFQ